MSTGDESAPSPEQPGRPRRRKRYAGTHPRRFDERYKELQPGKYPDMHEHIRAQGRTPAGTHVPVLMAESLKVLRPVAGEVVADCTLGFAGHAREFLKRIQPGGRLIGLDCDGVQLERARARLAEMSGAYSLHRTKFAGLPKVLEREQVRGVDIVFADLGVSSMQIDDPARGLSYKHDGPLDMRLDDRAGRTAADWLARASGGELAGALREFADEPDAEVIAEAVVARRRREALATTGQLVDLVLAAKGLTRRNWRLAGDSHPAARTFQALRILVNDELGALAELLRVAPNCLNPGGRIGIISFHSGEDRLVKRAFSAGREGGLYRDVSDDVVRPSAGERRDNPRSGSARLRWAVRAGSPE